jgi:hypothetical protein
MTDVTLHFEGQAKMSEAELAAFSQKLQEKTAELAEVEKTRSEPIRTKFAGLDDVILVLTISAKVFGGAALSLEALHRLIAAAKAVAHDMGWAGKVTVEADGGRVKPEELTEDDASFISTGAES